MYALYILAGTVVIFAGAVACYIIIERHQWQKITRSRYEGVGLFFTLVMTGCITLLSVASGLALIAHGLNMYFTSW